MKRILFVIAILLSGVVCAQKQSFEQYKIQQQGKLQKYKSSKQKQYDDYRQKINADYATYMARQWKVCKSHAAKRKPKDQDPPTPIIKKGDEPSPINEIQYKVIVTVVPYEQPEPVVPIDEAPAEEKPEFRFLFHGTSCSVHLNNMHKYTLTDATEQAASEMWKHLSNPVYDGVIADCLHLRKELQLADWGYINLLQALTQGFLGANSNEATLMQMYILTQSGYAARIARTGNKWVLLIPFEESIYDYSFIICNDLTYYILDKANSQATYYMFDKAFPEEGIPSLHMAKTPKLAFSASPQRVLVSKRYPQMKVTISENRNLIDFYNQYPISSKWDFYSATSLSSESKQAIYPILRKEIAGKSKYDAANMLINFVQTAFEYQTDGQQFGYERPLFGDETLYYPYSDCEDRSILYSILVRELLGLEVVLLEYPGHIATAIAFPDNKSYGYHFTYNNQKYTICDPTYIGADAGACMPNYRQTSPNIIEIR